MKPYPRLIKRVPKGFQVSWTDGHQSEYGYAQLRRNCPCAGCRQTSPRVVEADDPLRLIDDVPIHADGAELVGDYAVAFQWNDGHHHGIYSFEYLRSLCRCGECADPRDDSSPIARRR